MLAADSGIFNLRKLDIEFMSLPSTNLPLPEIEPTLNRNEKKVSHEDKEDSDEVCWCTSILSGG
jgi:hypothetical protein